MARMHSDRKPAPYLPFTGGDYKLGMGLKPLAAEDWIEPDDGFAAYLARKRELLATRHDEVFAALPAATAAASELLAMLSRHLVACHPSLFGAEGDRLVNKVTGEEWNIADPELHPLELAGRLVQEDFCVLLPAGATHLLSAACLCFPSRWRLADKLGHGLAEIHGPVPGYQQRLATPVDRFLGLLQPDKPVWRLNWLVHDDPSLFQPRRTPPTVPITADNAGDRLWLRVERQTLRRLPVSGSVIFTIRTHITPLGVAIDRPDIATDLATSIRTMPVEMRDYRQLSDIEDALLQWLDGRVRS
jgi:hypothetical protein